MSMTMTGGGSASASDLFADFERGDYDMEVTGLALTKSELYQDKDGNPKEQVQVTFVLPDVDDPNTGKPLERKAWLNAVLLSPNPQSKSPRGQAGSQLWRLVLAASGTRCQDGVEYDLEELLLGKRVRALVSLNDKGFPRIDNDSFAPPKGAKAPQKPAPPAAAAPARPTPPKPPAPPAGPSMLTPNQIDLVHAGWRDGGFGDDAALAAWVSANYGGRALAQVRADEWEGLQEALGIAPF